MFQRDDVGVEYVTFSEGLTKTRGDGLRVKPRLAIPKIFATDTKRCPVALLKEYLDKHPAELKLTGPVYLGVMDKPQTSVWYKKCPRVKTP